MNSWKFYKKNTTTQVETNCNSVVCFRSIWPVHEERGRHFLRIFFSSKYFLPQAIRSRWVLESIYFPKPYFSSFFSPIWKPRKSLRRHTPTMRSPAVIISSTAPALRPDLGRVSCKVLKSYAYIWISLTLLGNLNNFHAFIRVPKAVGLPSSGVKCNIRGVAYVKINR